MRQGKIPSRRKWALIGLPAVMRAGIAVAAPVVTQYPVDGPDDTVAVAAAQFGGSFAVADSFADSVEIRDISQSLIRTITKSEIQAAMPWLALNGSVDGPSALAYTHSGQRLFVSVFDDTGAGDGQPSDGILEYHRLTDDVSLFARQELASSAAAPPNLALVFQRGRLFAGDAFGNVTVYDAPSTVSTGVVAGVVALPSGSPVRGLAVDRDSDVLYAVGTATVYCADISGTDLPTLVSLGQLTNEIQGIAFSDHFGGSTNAGLYLLTTTQDLWFVPPAQCNGIESWSPTLYLSDPNLYFDVAATPCGRLLAGSGEDAFLISDDTDTRLGYHSWLTNEVQQVIGFAKSLITTNPMPVGWVIDSDVQQLWSRFHPASPDAALWAVALLAGSDRVFGDPAAQGLASHVLERYAGMAADGIEPVRSSDGIFLHWYEPATGLNKAGWTEEYATLSAMKAAAAGPIALRQWPGDDTLRRATSRILDSLSNWTNYYAAGTDAMYFLGAAGGGPVGNPVAGFHEGLLFAAEAAAYGAGQSLFQRWMTRSNWPTAEYLSGYPVTGNSAGHFQAAFISIYCQQLVAQFHDHPDWQAQVRNLCESHAAWTDDHGPRWFTVFSAGTTKPEWSGGSGYNADSLSSHPGDITTFPALMGFCATGDSVPAVAAYQAYRRGARQTFSGGAGILYRRSSVDEGYQPNSAGLPDVAMGAIGLMELLQPGLVRSLFAGEFPPRARVTELGLDVGGLMLNWQGLSPDYLYTVQVAETPKTGWMPAPGVWPITALQATVPGADPHAVYRLLVDR